MKVFRRSTVAMVVGLFAVGGVVTNPTAAQADFSNCPDESGYLCFWTDTAFQGPMGKLSGSNVNWDVFNQAQCFGATWEDCASSIRNEGLNCEAVVWRDRGHSSGPSWVINRDTSAADLTQWSMQPGLSWNNQISSNSWWCG